MESFLWAIVNSKYDLPDGSRLSLYLTLIPELRRGKGGGERDKSEVGINRYTLL